ncbi:DNA helicase [Serratia phage vB_SmaM_Hera]|uniref:DNA helicase n=2 Tax=Myosmarvirus MTx TaxID=2846180 RepID=A0A482MG36_9CAUD|nr:Dda-like helicase [Serratia phage MTx]QBQ72385.1 DNA helicase [Serratia phage MTx]QPX74687.1 DNA helicase [Serratia phage vB_SmaM_Hera]
MSELILNGEQDAAVKKAVAWYKGFRDGRHRTKKHFLSGFAGTGKTTVAKLVATLCAGDRVVFIAPTGKAASRLRLKGAPNATTLHSFLYRVVGENADEEPIFTPKGTLDVRPLLIVLDEACMVSEWDVNNLLALNIPLLALGDVGQVDPVKGRAYFSEGTQDSLLEQIMRQGEQSNIIRASFFVRKGGRLPVREYDDVKVRIGRPTQRDVLNHCGEDSVMLCAYNSTRNYLNTRARVATGHSGLMPNIGEKVICTFNQHGPGFFNGEQGIVLGYEDLSLEEAAKQENEDLQFIVLRSLTDGRELKAFFNPLCFNHPEPEMRPMFQKYKGGFDFGYALTIHKSQGSEWDNVLLMEETLPGTPYNKLMYTGITRAAKNLMFFRKD